MNFGLYGRSTGPASISAESRASQRGVGVGPALAWCQRTSLSAMIGGPEEDRRAAFVLTQMLGLSYAEAAEACRCPVGTIRSRVAREELVAAVSGTGDRGQRSDLGR